MSLRLDLFCEDVGHEAFARALAGRLSSELDVELAIRVASARAGLGRAQRELKAYMQVIRRRAGTPDLLIVIADGNDVGPQARREEIEHMGLDEVFPVYVIGTPDPCVEAWLLADPPSLAAEFGHPPQGSRPTSGKAMKRYLADYLEQAGKVVMEGGTEFADEIVRAMDLFRAGKNEPTLKRFVDDLKAALEAVG